MTILPWKCNYCRNEFQVHAGGLCSRCNKAMCSIHIIKIVNGKEKNRKDKELWLMVCPSCRQPDDVLYERKKK